MSLRDFDDEQPVRKAGRKPGRGEVPELALRAESFRHLRVLDVSFDEAACGGCGKYQSMRLVEQGCGGKENLVGRLHVRGQCA